MGVAKPGLRVAHPPTEQTATGRLVREWMDRDRNGEAWSERKLAAAVGVSHTVIHFLVSGRDGQGIAYYGARPRRRGERPLVFRVAEVLGIPEAQVKEAVYADMGYILQPERKQRKHLAVVRH